MVRELGSLEKKVVERIYEGLRKLAYTPFPGRIKGLKKIKRGGTNLSSQGWRLSDHLPGSETKCRSLDGCKQEGS